jgi:hypothetical protein
MRRRSLLAATVGLGSGLLAGCLDSSNGGSATTTTTPSNGMGCPQYSDRIDRVVCTPDLGDPSMQMAMQPPDATGELPTDTITLTLENTRNTAFRTNFYAWRLQKHVDGAWYHVTPRFWPEPLMELAPGDSHAWQVTVDNTDLEGTLPHPQGTDRVTVVGLGGGTYSFGVEGQFGGDGSTPRTAFVTRFDLDGPALTLTPAPGITDRARDGDKVLLDWRADEGDPRTYRVTQLPSVPADAQRVIAEQAIQEDPLRTALAMFERWSRIVEIRTGADALQGFLVDVPTGGERTIAYRDTGYRIEVETGH